MMVNLLLITSLLLLGGPANPQYSIGDKVKNFSLTNTGDNKIISLSDFVNRKAVAIIFTSLATSFLGSDKYERPFAVAHAAIELVLSSLLPVWELININFISASSYCLAIAISL